MTETLAIDPSYRTNADLIAACAEMGYLDGLVLDCTYGRGAFWRHYRPIDLHANDISDDIEVDTNYDFRALPADWADEFDAVVLDPPYKLDGTPDDRGPATSNTSYGVGQGDRDYETPADIDQLYRDGCNEAVRVTRPGGHVLVKSMNQVVGGKTHWQTRNVANHMETLGCRHVTDLILVGHRKQPGGRRQLNVRNNYSTLAVFEVGRSASLFAGDAA